MKYIIYLFLLVNTVAYTQAKLEVKLHDVCGETNNFTSLIQLYEGQNLIAEANQVHHTFEGLNPDGVYTVKVKATPMPNENYGIKDVVLMQNHILGINKLNRYGALASDINLDGKTSASDIVPLKKFILGLNQDTTKKVYIIDSLHTTSPPNFSEINDEYFFNGIKNNHQILDLTVVQMGHVAEATGQYCNEKCADIIDKHAQILFDDVNVKKGTAVFVSLYLKNEYNYRAVDFTFNVTDANIVSIDLFSFLYNRNQNQIHAIWTNPDFNNIVSPKNIIANFTIMPERDGKLSEFVYLEADNPNNEAVIRDGNCIRSIKQLVMVPSTNFSHQCDIVWPSDITISKCQDHSGEPQISQICQNVVSINYFDSHIEQCKKIERYWELQNWVSGEIIKHTQYITVDENFDHICHQNVQINLYQDSKLIKASNLVVNPNPDHSYSFTSSAQDSTRTFSNEFPHTLQVEVYDLTTSKVCVAGIAKNFVEDVSFVVVPHIIIKQSKDIYTVSATDFSNVGINLPSNITDILISYNGGNFTSEFIFDKSVSGQKAEFYLKYSKNGTTIYYGLVSVYFEPNTFIENVDPLELFTYNDYLLPGKEYNLDIYSTNFHQILSFQYGAILKNAKLSGVKNGVLKVTNSYSYMADQDILRMLWFDESALPKSIDQNTILFTLIIKPDEAGYVADFISLSENALTAEAAFEGSVLSGKIHLEFGFKTRTSGVDNNETTSDRVEIYPNPLIDNTLNIKWPIDFKPIYMTIYDASGKIMLKKSDSELPHHSMSIQVLDSWPKGIYFITINNDLRILSKKIAITN